MNMKITYKNLTYEDIPMLTPIMKCAFDEDTKMHTNLSEDGPPGYGTGELLEKRLQLLNAVSKVIYADGQMIGEYTILCENDIFYLDMLFIDPQYASKGIGTMVWNDIEKEYKDAKIWILETPEYSIRNHHFYRKFGFQVIKEFVYPDGAKSLVFEKRL